MKLTDLLPFTNKVKQECSVYSQNNPNNIKLYRGAHRTASHLGIEIKKIKHTHQSRPDDNYNVELSSLMRQDGYTATRMDVFVSPSLEHAKEFGTVFVVLPIGNYSFTWLDPDQMKNIIDSLNIETVEHMWRPYEGVWELGGFRWSRMAQQIMKAQDPNILPKEFTYDNMAKVFWNTFKSCFRQSKNPADVKNANTEAYLYCKEYYLVNVNYWNKKFAQ